VKLTEDAKGLVQHEEALVHAAKLLHDADPMYFCPTVDSAASLVGRKVRTTQGATLLEREGAFNGT